MTKEDEDEDSSSFNSNTSDENSIDQELLKTVTLKNENELPNWKPPNLKKQSSLAHIQATFNKNLELGREKGNADAIFAPKRRRTKWSENEDLSKEMQKIREEQQKRNTARRIQLAWELCITVGYGFGMTFVPYFIAFHPNITTSQTFFIIFFEFLVVIDLCISHYYYVIGKTNSNAYLSIFNYNPDIAKKKQYFQSTPSITLESMTWIFIEWLGGFPYQSILIFAYGVDYLNMHNVLKSSFLLLFLRVFARDRIQRMYTFSQHNNFTQLIRLLTFSALVMWGLCCVGFSISCFSDTDDSWCKQFEEQYDSEIERAIQFCYLISVALQGENIEPLNIYEAWFALLVSVFGAAMVAVVFGAIYVLVETYSHGQRTFEENLGVIERASNLLRLPEQLTEDIKAYNDYTQSKYSSGEFERFKSLMTEHLSEEVSFWQFGEYLTKMDLLEDCSAPFIRLICNRMQLKVYAPGDTIIEQGDKDSTMFLVYEGEVGVYVRKGDEKPPGALVSTQGKGSFFGEVSLLYTSLRRTATVKALGFCDIYVLRKVDLERIINRYPEDAEIMFSNANRLMKERYSKERLKSMFDIIEPGAQKRESETEKSMDGRRNAILMRTSLLDGSQSNLGNYDNMTDDQKGSDENSPRHSLRNRAGTVSGGPAHASNHDSNILKDILESVQTIKVRTGELNYEFGKMDKRLKKVEKNIQDVVYQQDGFRVEGESNSNLLDTYNETTKSDVNKRTTSVKNLTPRNVNRTIEQEYCNESFVE